jgi:hypothetical protein
MANEYASVGEYELKEVLLTTHEGREIDLSNIVMSIEYVESIFNPFMTGKLFFYDSMDLYQLAPLIGQEKIVFEYTTGGDIDVVRKEFATFKIEPLEDITSEYTKVVIHFVSVEAFTSTSTKISKSYKQKTASNIARDVYSYFDTNKKIDIDSTLGLHDVIIPSWTPVEAISWLSSISVSANDVGSMFVFYEDQQGYNFKNIESLYKKDIKTSFSKTLLNMNTSDDYNLAQILSHTALNGGADTLESIAQGLFSTSVIAYDNISKNAVTYNYNYDDKFDKTTHLNDFKLVSDEFEYKDSTQHVVYVSSKGLRSSNEGSINYEQSSLYRSSLLSQLESRQMILETYGLSTVTAGDVVEVNLPNTSRLQEAFGDEHRYFRRNFLITTLVHKFSRREYQQKITVMADSLPSPVNGYPKV